MRKGVQGLGSVSKKFSHLPRPVPVHTPGVISLSHLDVSSCHTTTCNDVNCGGEGIGCRMGDEDPSGTSGIEY